MKLLLLNILLFFSGLIFCQNQDVNYVYDYTPIKSKGVIPSEYKKLASEKYNNDLISSENNNETLSKKEKEFLLLSNYEINQTLFSGRVLFGDKITIYLNKILDELLKNDTTLRRKIRIYTFKSSTVNAACTSNGTIFVNIGLLPYLENEAELAFIISHEISHFVKEHSLNKYIEKKAIFEAKESFDQKINKLFTQSKEKEFEADSMGTILFLKSNYNVTAVSSSLNKLYYSYLPYKEVPFDPSFFNGDNFIIPSSFFLDSLASISPIGNFNDRYLTHPNISKRKEQTTKVLKQQKGSGDKNFIISKKTFLEVQELSKFENIRLSILQKQYGNVIYYAHDLLQTYPENEYLNTAVCKALYGLGKYKNLDQYQEVAKSYHRTEGEIQQIHYLLRKLNRFQLNVVAIKYIQKTINQFPNNKFILRLMDNLIEDLVIVHGIKVKKYFNSSFDNKIANNEFLFHKNAFIKGLKNNSFIESFEKYYLKLDSLEKWNKLSYRTKEKLQEIETKKIKKNGLKFEVKKVIVFDPSYKFFSSRNGIYIKTEKKKKWFINQISKSFKNTGLSIELINSKKLTSESLSFYNELSLLQEWINEKWSHDDDNFIPLLSDQTERIIQKYNTNYLYYSGIFEAPRNSYYFMKLYDLRSGKSKMSVFEDSNYIPQEKAYKLINKNIELLAK